MKNADHLSTARKSYGKDIGIFRTKSNIYNEFFWENSTGLKADNYFRKTVLSTWLQILKVDAPLKQVSVFV